MNEKLHRGRHSWDGKRLAEKGNCHHSDAVGALPGYAATIWEIRVHSPNEQCLWSRWHRWCPLSLHVDVLCPPLLGIRLTGQGFSMPSNPSIPRPPRPICTLHSMLPPDAHTTLEVLSSFPSRALLLSSLLPEWVTAAQLCLALWDPKDCSLSSSSLEFSRQEY